MTIRGNYHFYYALQIAMGIIIYVASLKANIANLGIIVLIFQIPYFLIMHKHKPDEREISLNHKIDSFGMAFTSSIAVIIYLLFPHINWFFALFSGIFIARGLTGLLIFSLE